VDEGLELRSPETLKPLEGHGHPKMNDDGEPILDDSGQPIFDYGGEDVVWRLELLSGHLSDYVTHTHELVKRLKIRANASHTTRSQLSHLNDLTGDIWQHLRIMREEIAEIKRFYKNETEHCRHP
jgi:hypothetical protein